jgi:hypothetical protein
MVKSLHISEKHHIMAQRLISGKNHRLSIKDVVEQALELLFKKQGDIDAGMNECQYFTGKCPLINPSRNDCRNCEVVSGYQQKELEESS